MLGLMLLHPVCLFSKNIDCSVFQAGKLQDSTRIEQFLTQVSASQTTDSIFWFYRKVYCSSLQVGYLKGQVDGLNGLGFYYYVISDFEAAEQILKTGMSLADSLGYEHGLSDAHNYYGLLMYEMGNHAEALQHQIRVSKIGEEINNVRMQADANTNIGRIFLSARDYDRAREYFNAALNLYQKMGEEFEGIGWIYHYLGTLHADQHQYLLAESWLKKAIDFWEVNHIPRGLNHSLVLLGDLLFNLNIDKSLNYYLRAEKLSIEQGNMERLAHVKISLSSYFENQGGIEQAIQYAYAAYQISKTHGHKESAKTSCEKLSSLYEQTGRYKESLFFLQEKLAFQQQLIDLKTLQTQHWLRGELEKQNTHMANLQLKKEQLEHEKTILKQQVWLYIILSGLFLLFIFFIIQIRNLKQKKQRNRELNQLNNKLTDELEKGKQMEQEREEMRRQLEASKQLLEQQLGQKILMLNQEQEFYNFLFKKLKKLNVSSGSEPVRKELENSIKKKVNNRIWEELDVEFGHINQDFYTQLSNEFPKLTPNDLRLCSLLKLGLSTKEIAEIQVRTPESVKMARNRLRKKLGLKGRDQNLSTFLHAYSHTETQRDRVL